MGGKNNSPQTKRAAGSILILLGSIWLMVGIFFTAVLDGFLPIGLLWYAVSIAVLLLGIYTRRHANDCSTPKKQQPGPAFSGGSETTAPGESKNATEKAPASSFGRCGNTVFLWQADEAGMVFYPQREQALAFSCVLAEGQPLARLTTVVETQQNAGEPHIYRQYDQPVPEEMRRQLTADSLLAWIRNAFSSPVREMVPWGEIGVTPELSAWCERVRLQAILKVPASLYQMENPFESALEDVGPDGLKDESGVACFLGIRAGADIHAVIRDAVMWTKQITEQSVTEANLAQASNATIVFFDRYMYQKYCGLRKVILSRDRGLLSSVTEEEKQQCRAEKITFAVAFPEGLYDLLEQREVPLTWQEWPGSADDAATYGAWQLQWNPSISKG